MTNEIDVVRMQRDTALDAVKRLTRRLDYYESAVQPKDAERTINPVENLLMGGVEHRFNEDGICIRCGCDAESWDEGCVEQLLAEIDALTARVAELEKERYAPATDKVISLYSEGNTPIVVLDFFLPERQMIAREQFRYDLLLRWKLPDDLYLCRKET